MKWLNDVFPDNDQWQTFSNSVINITESLKNSIEIGKYKLHHLTYIQSNNFSSCFILRSKTKKVGRR